MPYHPRYSVHMGRWGGSLISHRTAAGDFLGIGKALKKLKPGKLLLNAASMLPGVGGVIAKTAAVLTNPQKRYQAELAVARKLPFGSQAVDVLGLGTNPYMSTLADFHDVVGGGGSTAPAVGGGRGGLPALPPPLTTSRRGRTWTGRELLGGSTRRRMNYCNMKAARRAGRRITGAIKQLRSLERALPHIGTHHARISKARKRGR